MSRLRELGLDLMELEFVRATFPGEVTARGIAEAAREDGIRLTAHGPYYINLNAQEPKKLNNSRDWVLTTAVIGNLCGAESITFHPGFFHGQDAHKVFLQIRKELEAIVAKLNEQHIEIDVRPEVTGKPSAFGSLEELVALAEAVEGISPCIDWSHLHARTGKSNTPGEFQDVLDVIRSRLGEEALHRVHFHVSGIMYGPKGERKHLNLDESDFNYKELLKVLKDNGVCGFVTCESPSIEDDARILKDYYEKIS